MDYNGYSKRFFIYVVVWLLVLLSSSPIYLFIYLLLFKIVFSNVDLKLGISERSIFHEFHPDAEALFNVTCDLKLVCEKLQDRTQRHKRQVWNEMSSLLIFNVFYIGCKAIRCRQ